jgi:sugar lactone lactonase YvrE
MQRRGSLPAGTGSDAVSPGTREVHVTVLRILSVLAGALVLAATPASGARNWPDVIPLPTGFQPEGIDIAQGRTFYVGSIPTGAVYRGDLRTGKGAVLVPAQSGRAAIGIDVDGRKRIFVAGGPTGMAWVYDARTGATLASYQLVAGPPTFVNDVIVTKDAAWFTESQAAVLYRVPIEPGGELGSQADVQRVPLTGDFMTGPGFNVNGIDATPDGRTLVIVQSNTGRLFTVNPATGVARGIALRGGTVANGDGILLSGKTLYAVRNQDNVIAVVRLANDLQRGTIARTIADRRFDVPTTIDESGRFLYAVNARFGTNPTPSTRYEVVRVPKLG